MFISFCFSVAAVIRNLVLEDSFIHFCCFEIWQHHSYTNCTMITSISISLLHLLHSRTKRLLNWGPSIFMFLHLIISPSVHLLIEFLSLFPNLSPFLFSFLISFQFFSLSPIPSTGNHNYCVLLIPLVLSYPEDSISLMYSTIIAAHNFTLSSVLCSPDFAGDSVGALLVPTTKQWLTLSTLTHSRLQTTAERISWLKATMTWGYKPKYVKSNLATCSLGKTSTMVLFTELKLMCKIK